MNLTDRPTPLTDAQFHYRMAEGKEHFDVVKVKFARALEQHAEALAEIAGLAAKQIACDDPECDMPCCKKILTALADWQVFKKGVTG